MRCIIVDDDLFSTKIVSDFINRTSSLTLVKTFDSAIDAVDYLNQTTGFIQVIFLDIEMPEMSGLEFIKSIDRSLTQIIICSSQEKYALMSYEYDVCDYLLKPVNYARFLKAINKAKSELDKSSIMMEGLGESSSEGSGSNQSMADDSQVQTYMYIRDATGEKIKLNFKDVACIEAQENYVCLYTPEGRYSVHTTMKSIMEGLPEKYVMRVHRSYAVGVGHVKKIKGDLIIVEGKEEAVPISRAFRDKVKDYFKMLLKW